MFAMADRYAPLPTWQVLTGTLPPGDDRYLPPPPMADRLLTLKEALKGLDDFFYHYHHGGGEGGSGDDDGESGDKVH